MPRRRRASTTSRRLPAARAGRCSREGARAARASSRRRSRAGRRRAGRTGRPRRGRPRDRGARGRRAASGRAPGSRARAPSPRRSSRRPAPPRPGSASRGALRTAGSSPAAAQIASSAARDERVVREARRRAVASASRKRDLVGEREPLEHGDDLVLAVAPQRADDEREVELRRRVPRRARAQRTSASASATNSSGASASARTSRPRPIAASAATTSSRLATPASASEFASVLRRCANAPRTTAAHRSASAGAGIRVEGDERRLDVRRRSEDRARDRVEARSHRVEPDEHGDGAIRLRPRLGEEAVGDLALHHHAPRRRASAARRGSRRRAVSRRCTGGSRRAWSAAARARPRSSASASPKCSVDVRSRPERLAERRLERPVELDGMDEPHAVCEERREHAEPRADLEHDVGRVERASRSITPRTFRSTRKCWPSDLLRGDGAHAGRARTRPLAFASIRASSSSARLAAGDCAEPRVCGRTCAGSFGRPRTGCGARYGLSVSARSRSAGNSRGGARRSSARREGDVARKRDVVAALEGRLQQLGLGEAVEDHRPAERRERRGRLRRRLAAVDDDRAARARRRARAARRRATVAHEASSAPWWPSSPVSPTATARGCPRSSRSSSTRAGVGRRRLMGIDPERGDDAVRGRPRSRARGGTSRCPCRS